MILFFRTLFLNQCFIIFRAVSSIALGYSACSEQVILCCAVCELLVVEASRYPEHRLSSCVWLVAHSMCLKSSDQGIRPVSPTLASELPKYWTARVW